MKIEGVISIDTKSNKVIIKFSEDKKVNPQKFLKFLEGAIIEVENQDIITRPQFNYINALCTDFHNTFGDSTQTYKNLLKEMYCDKYNLQWFSTKSTTKQNAINLIDFIIETGIEWGVEFKVPPYLSGTNPEKYVLACLKYRVCARCGKRHEDGVTIDLHHQKTVASNGGRNINDDNLEKIPLCRICHSYAHSIGLRNFADKYNLRGVLYSSEEWYGKKLWSRLRQSEKWGEESSDLDVYQTVGFQIIKKSLDES